MKKIGYRVRDFLGASFDCACGRHHETHFSNYIVECGAVKKIPGLLDSLGYKKPFLLCDTHTYEKGGKLVEEVLKEAGIPYSSLILESPEVGDLPASEEPMGKLVMGFDLTCDIFISIGTGTLNDLGRYFTYMRGKEFMLVATAPSMDGLVSANAALIYNRMKITYQAHSPIALICDLDILREAPMKMLNAGVGDILGKYNCLTDWKLSNIVNGEYFCDTLESIVRDSVEKTNSCMEQLKERREEDVETLVDALTLSGIAMDFIGNSRPASGAEHHLSHFWEMQFLFDGRTAVLHGAKVGIGTVIALRLYNELAVMEKPDFEALRGEVKDRMGFDAWEQVMKEVYRDAAPSVIALEKEAGKNDPEKLLKRLDVIDKRWEEIRALASGVPQASDLERKLVLSGAPARPSDVGIETEYVREAVLYAKEVRNRYTVLQLLFDIGKLPEMADLVVREYC